MICDMSLVLFKHNRVRRVWLVAVGLGWCSVTLSLFSS